MTHYTSGALKREVLRSGLSAAELTTIFAAQYKRNWNINISRSMSKAHFLKYVGRYIRQPPVAQRRLKRITDHEVEYLAKDTMNDRMVRVRTDCLAALPSRQVVGRLHYPLEGVHKILQGLFVRRCTISRVAA